MALWWALGNIFGLEKSVVLASVSGLFFGVGIVCSGWWAPWVVRSCLFEIPHLLSCTWRSHLCLSFFTGIVALLLGAGAVTRPPNWWLPAWVEGMWRRRADEGGWSVFGWSFLAAFWMVLSFWGLALVGTMCDG